MKVRVLFVAALTCLTTIEALLSQGKQRTAVKQSLEEVKNKCIPGKFYKRGCKQCFCGENKRPVCGGSSNCKLGDKLPTSPSFIHSYSSAELTKLPALSHQASECKPGASYRVDCNTCVCLANKNLMCNDLLCPSYDDVNRIKAKSATGKACTDEKKDQECIKCNCVNSTLKCEAISKCVPTEGRRDFQEPPLDLAVDDMKNGDKTCTPGMVYKRDCNRCYCQKDSSLRCTLMKCLKNSEVKRLQKLRIKLEKDGL